MVCFIFHENEICSKSVFLHFFSFFPRMSCPSHRSQDFFSDMYVGN
jgi:hypothetical protein